MTMNYKDRAIRRHYNVDSVLNCWGTLSHRPSGEKFDYPLPPSSGEQQILQWLLGWDGGTATQEADTTLFIYQYDKDQSICIATSDFMLRSNLVHSIQEVKFKLFCCTEKVLF